MVIGTAVGTAILILLVVYGVIICRHRKRKTQIERYQRKSNYDDKITLNAIVHDDETGRAEAYSLRDEKQRANWPVRSKPVVTTRQMYVTQKAQLVYHRPNLPPLQEKTPRVSEKLDLYPPGEGPSSTFDYHAIRYTPEPPAPGVPEEPEPVKLALTKRQSRGGKQRLAVTRVGSVSQQGGQKTTGNTTPSSTNPYFSGPVTSGVTPFPRPPLIRTPSSDTLPHPNSRLPSPLALNPLLGAATAPHVSAFTWGSRDTEPLPQAPRLPSQYQNLKGQVQPDWPYTNVSPNTNPQYTSDRSANHVGFLLDPNHPSPQPAQTPTYSTTRPSNTGSSSLNAIPTMSGAGAKLARSSDLSPQPSDARNHLSISLVSSYSSMFDNPLASPSFMSPLSPPPKSPLCSGVQLSKSEYTLREHNVSPPSSDEEGLNSAEKPMPPLPSRRRSCSSGELGAVGLAQATAGLDLDIGLPGGAFFGTAGRTTGPRPPTLTRTNTDGTTVSDVISRASSPRSSNTNTNPDGGGRYTFLASSSSGRTLESDESVTPTSP